jgi:isopenicillin N synthase-like dioxygenase
VLFRVFHYPALADNADADEWGVGEHTDYGLLTLLAQDGLGGLQVRSPSGDWIDVPAEPGVLVCNIGDMLDRLTEGRYRSTPHRVRNTSGRGRLSFPYFFDPSWDAEVTPLPLDDTPPTDDATSRWDGTSVHAWTGRYGDYLAAKVAKVFPDLFEQLGHHTTS